MHILSEQIFYHSLNYKEHLLKCRLQSYKKIQFNNFWVPSQGWMKYNSCHQKLQDKAQIPAEQKRFINTCKITSHPFNRLMLKIPLLPGLERLSLGFPHTQNTVWDYAFGI